MYGQSALDDFKLKLNLEQMWKFAFCWAEPSLASVGREEISSCQSKNVTDCYYPIKIELLKNQISKNQNGFYLASKCIFRNISLTLKLEKMIVTVWVKFINNKYKT